MTVMINAIIILLGLFVLDYAGSKFKDKRTIPERFLDISMLFLSATIVSLAAEQILTYIFG